MRVVCYISPRKDLDVTLASALCKGIKRHGDRASVRSIAEFAAGEPGSDAAIVVGVKGRSRHCFRHYTSRKKPAAIVDKGYTRQGNSVEDKYWRISVGEFQPLSYFQKIPRSAYRWDQLHLPIHDWTNCQDGLVVFAGSSQKYCNWFDLGGATEYATKILHELSKLTSLPLVYRPKPSWSDAKPIQGYRYSGPDESLASLLPKTVAIVTFGSNAAVEGILQGVPAIVLGDGIAHPLSGTSLKSINRLQRPTADVVRQWAHDLAYCQWTPEEFASGEAWVTLRPRFAELLR